MNNIKKPVQNNRLTCVARDEIISGGVQIHGFDVRYRDTKFFVVFVGYNYKVFDEGSVLVEFNDPPIL